MANSDIKNKIASVVKFLTRNHHLHREQNHQTIRGDSNLVDINDCLFDRGQVRTRVFTKSGAFVTSFPAHFSDEDIKVCLYRMNDAYSRGVESAKVKQK